MQVSKAGLEYQTLLPKPPEINERSCEIWNKICPGKNVSKFNRLSELMDAQENIIEIWDGGSYQRTKTIMRCALVCFGILLTVGISLSHYFSDVRDKDGDRHLAFVAPIVTFVALTALSFMVSIYYHYALKPLPGQDWVESPFIDKNVLLGLTVVPEANMLINKCQHKHFQKELSATEGKYLSLKEKIKEYVNGNYKELNSALAQKIEDIDNDLHLIGESGFKVAKNKEIKDLHHSKKAYEVAQDDLSTVHDYFRS